MQLRGYHLGAAAALETRENADAAAAGVADRHDAVFNRDAAFALALLTQFNGFGRHPDIAARPSVIPLSSTYPFSHSRNRSCIRHLSLFRPLLPVIT